MYLFISIDYEEYLGQLVQAYRCHSWTSGNAFQNVGSYFNKIIDNFGERCRALGNLQKVCCTSVTKESLELQMASAACFHQHWHSCTCSLCTFPMPPWVHSEFSFYQHLLVIKRKQVLASQESFTKLLLHWKKSRTDPCQLVYISSCPWYG